MRPMPAVLKTKLNTDPGGYFKWAFSAACFTGALSLLAIWICGVTGTETGIVISSLAGMVLELAVYSLVAWLYFRWYDRLPLGRLDEV